MSKVSFSSISKLLDAEVSRECAVLPIMLLNLKNSTLTLEYNIKLTARDMLYNIQGAHLLAMKPKLINHSFE